MISHKHRCIFIHIPRTGGTSIERALGGPVHARLLSWAAESASLRKKGRRDQTIHGERRDLLLPSMLTVTGLLPLYRKMYGAKHFKAQQARRFYGASTWEEYFTFAFVRNTWDRLLSSYHFRRDVLKYRVEAELTFRDWIRRRCGSDDEIRRQNQLVAISDPSGEVLVDWIGRFEHLQDGFDELSARLGLDGRRLPKVYQSRSRRYPEYYDEETRDMVAEAFRDEIEFFHFAFDAPNDA